MNEPSASFARLLDRLSGASVTRRWEAYRDIRWDDPELQVRVDDPRWVLPSWDPLGGTEWYREQPAQIRSQVGLLRVLVLLKVGIEFETAVQQGLLAVAAGLPDGHPAFRYLYHEITEEAQHSMMFQEVINRSGVRVPGSSRQELAALGTISADAHGDWAMFFLAVLAGEEVFDRIQRRLLADRSLHPLLRRVFEIHVAEEARHLSFARACLREVVPRQDAKQRRLLAYRAPSVVGWTTRHITCSPSLAAALATHCQMPDDVRFGLHRSALAGELRWSAVAGVVRLCEQLDLVDARLASQWADLRPTAPVTPEPAR